MISKLKKLILTSYFISALIAIIIIVSLPPIFNKYEILLIDHGDVVPSVNAIVYHVDLDGDGNSERIVSYTNHVNEHAIQVQKSEGGIFDQWNGIGGIPNFNSQRLITGDYDKNNLLEIYLLYQIEDSIYLRCIDPFKKPNPVIFEGIKIFELDHKIAQSDCNVNEIYFHDINGDKKEELIFHVSTGRARFPRGIYVYDIANDTVYRSPNFGVNICSLKFADLDGDGKSEIFGNMAGSGNVDSTYGILYDDYSAWVIAYDHEFNLLFEPIEYPGFRSCVNMCPVYDSLITVYYHHQGKGKNFPEFMLLNAKGKILKKKTLAESPFSMDALFISHYNNELKYWIFNKTNITNAYDEDFNLVETKKLDDKYSGYEDIDFDGDSILEQLMFGDTKFLTIAKNNFTDITKYEFESPIPLAELSIIQRANKSNLIYIQDGDKYFKLEFAKNPIAFFEYFVYLGIFLASWLFIAIIRKLQLMQIRKRDNIRQQIVDLQLKGFRNQMDPHFTFNVFNAMAYKIKKDSPETYSAFMQFTNLIRKTLESSDKITRTIEEELSHLKSYLELEKLRFENKLDYDISVDPQIDTNVRIPKMILQTYVENAIKHGIRHKEGNGKVLVNLHRNEKAMVFSIEDDGIGRLKAKEVSTDSTGFGLKIMENYFQLFNEYNETKISHEIIDLYDDKKNPIGTKVSILIPLNFSYRLKKHNNG